MGKKRARRHAALLHTFVESVVRRAHELSDEHPTRGSLGGFLVAAPEAISPSTNSAGIDSFFMEELAREALRSAAIARELEGAAAPEKALRRALLADLRPEVAGKKGRARLLAPLLARIFDDDASVARWERRLRRPA